MAGFFINKKYFHHHMNLISRFIGYQSFFSIDFILIIAFLLLIFVFNLHIPLKKHYGEVRVGAQQLTHRNAPGFRLAANRLTGSAAMTTFKLY
jgi:hypothetical protein